MSTTAMAASRWSATYGKTLMQQARRGSALLGMTTTALTLQEVHSICWCDNNNDANNSQNWLVKDSNGGIDWNLTMHQYATVAGGQVSALFFFFSNVYSH